MQLCFYFAQGTRLLELEGSLPFREKLIYDARVQAVTSFKVMKSFCDQAAKHNLTSNFRFLG